LINRGKVAIRLAGGWACVIGPVLSLGPSTCLHIVLLSKYHPIWGTSLVWLVEIMRYHIFEWKVVRKRDEILATIVWDNLIWVMVGNILSHPQTLTRVRLLVPCQHQLRNKQGKTFHTQDLNLSEMDKQLLILIT